MATSEERARLYDAGAQTANSDIFGSDIDPTNSPSNLRVTVALKGSSIVNVKEDNGTSVVNYDFNSGTALGADELYVFDVPVRGQASTYNFQLESSVGIKVLNVDEVRNSEV